MCLCVGLSKNVRLSYSTCAAEYCSVFVETCRFEFYSIHIRKTAEARAESKKGTVMVVGEHGGKTYVYERMEAKDTDEYES